VSLQPLFRKFHQAIQLNDSQEGAELRKKRDDIIKKLRERLHPRTFTPFNQGSYEMGTGVKPTHGDYDIDVGLVFEANVAKEDPVTVKGWVYEAIKDHTHDVEWRRACITVSYRRAGRTRYHVDLAVMAKAPNSDLLHLALGKQHAAANLREWQPDNRQAFMRNLEGRFNGEDAAQFRRVIRYLKRWKDTHFPPEGHSAPTGLGLTVAAYRWFQVAKPRGEYDDLAATALLVRMMRQGFQPTGGGPRLVLEFPYAPKDDVFARMNAEQMRQFQQRLEKLSGWLEEARTSGNAGPLRQAFGTDFPLP
jgi:hypothetical protein